MLIDFAFISCILVVLETLIITSFAYLTHGNITSELVYITVEYGKTAPYSLCDT
jgi:hypothetical protein